MNNIDNNTETVNRTYQSKGPFIGIILFLVGILVLVITLVSNSITGPSSTTLTAQVVYASNLKPNEDNTAKVQTIDVTYQYNGKDYKTGIKNIVNGKYKEYDEIKIDVNKNNPINISIHGAKSNGFFSKIICSIIFISVGILLFLGIISFDNIGYQIWRFKRRLLSNKNNKNSDEQNKEKQDLTKTITSLIGNLLNNNK